MFTLLLPLKTPGPRRLSPLRRIAPCFHSPRSLYELTRIMLKPCRVSPWSLLYLTDIPVKPHLNPRSALLALHFPVFKVYKALRCLLIQTLKGILEGHL